MQFSLKSFFFLFCCSILFSFHLRIHWVPLMLEKHQIHMCICSTDQDYYDWNVNQFVTVVFLFHYSMVHLFFFFFRFPFSFSYFESVVSALPCAMQPCDYNKFFCSDLVFSLLFFRYLLCGCVCLCGHCTWIWKKLQFFFLSLLRSPATNGYKRFNHKNHSVPNAVVM